MVAVMRACGAPCSNLSPASGDGCTKNSIRWWPAGPARLRTCARPVISLGMPAKPLMVSLPLTLYGLRFCTFTWIGLRPVWMADREGEQNL